MAFDGVFRLLQIEDCTGDVLALRRSLKRTGAPVEITVAASAERALDLLAISPLSYFDLVLTDINLPGMSGLDFLAALKTRAVRVESLIFVLSSSTREADIALAYSRGADGFLVKPYDSETYERFGRFLVSIGHGDIQAVYDGIQVPQRRRA